MILEAAGVEIVMVVDEGELNAAEVGIEDVAINEQVGGKVCFNEEELRSDLHATAEVSAG